MKFFPAKGFVVCTAALIMAAVISECFAASTVIVIPDSPTAVEKFAAEELAGELGKCIGARLPIRHESKLKNPSSQSSTFLYVGGTKRSRSIRGQKPWDADGVLLKRHCRLAARRRRQPLYLGLSCQLHELPKYAIISTL